MDGDEGKKDKERGENDLKTLKAKKNNYVRKKEK